MSATLAQIEQELCRRIGPFEQLTASSTNASTQSLVYVDDIESSIEQGSYEGLYLLRRNATVDGDRIRGVKTYTADDGTLEVDRPYTNAPASAEALEVMALHPSRVVRVCAQRALDRCFVLDRCKVVLSAEADERDLTAALPWLTCRAQVLGASRADADSADMPAPVDWFKPFEKGGRVWLGAAPDPYPDDFYVWALRPASSRLNGLSAPACPTAADVTTGGALLANTVYKASVAVQTADGTSPACPVVKLYTATDASNTHAARLTVPKDDAARNYLLYVSSAAAPLRVATISETQRAAGCTVTAVDTVSATSPGAGIVDVRVVGTGAAAAQAAAPASDADVLDVALDYAATAAHAYAWENFRALLAPIAARGMAPSEDDVRRGWAAWVGRLPRPPDRVQLAHPYQLAVQSAWSHPWTGS